MGVAVVVGWLLAESRGNRVESELPGLPRRSSITFYGYCFQIRIGTVLSHTCRQRGTFCGCGMQIDAGNRGKGSLTS